MGGSRFPPRRDGDDRPRGGFSDRDRPSGGGGDRPRGNFSNRTGDGPQGGGEGGESGGSRGRPWVGPASRHVAMAMTGRAVVSRIGIGRVVVAVTGRGAISPTGRGMDRRVGGRGAKVGGRGAGHGWVPLPATSRWR